MLRLYTILPPLGVAAVIAASMRRTRLPYGGWTQRATSGSSFADITDVASTKASKAESASAAQIKIKTKKFYPLAVDSKKFCIFAKIIKL